MGSHTQTTTVWGSMQASIEGDRRTLVSTCKGCGQVTTQTLSISDNPFLAVKPEHVSGCRFGAWPKPQPILSAVPKLPIDSPRVSLAVWLAILLALLALAFVAGFAL